MMIMLYETKVGSVISSELGGPNYGISYSFWGGGSMDKFSGARRWITTRDY